jgi:perosamine synthetase
MTGLRRIAPAGAPIRAIDLARWAGVITAHTDVSASLRATIGQRFGLAHVFLTSTGRAGLTVLLKSLRQLAPAGRNEVIIPSYTCYSVAAAVVKAGLQPRLVDISVNTLDYDLERLRHTDFTKVLAVIATNLYGFPNDLPAISEIVKGRAFVIDDAAQAMGASVGSRPSGTWGDAGLYSFDKGKNVAAIDGGVIVTSSDPVASVLEGELRTLAPASAPTSGIGVAKALAYFTFLRPWLYGIPDQIPQLKLGQTHFTTDFPLQAPNRALLALALTMMKRLDTLTADRRRNAQALLDGLSRAEYIRPIAPGRDAIPVYLRLPLLIADAEQRDQLLAEFEAAGIGATGSYPASIADIDGLHDVILGSESESAGGRFVARHIVTLPTHPFVTPADIGRMVAIATRHGVEAARVPVRRSDDAVRARASLTR